MEVRAQDIVDSVDLGKSEVLLPLYESIVNSIISLLRTGRKDGRIWDRGQALVQTLKINKL